MNKNPESVLIVSDIEGTVGIYDKKQCKHDTVEWKKARELITEDINAAVRGIIKAGIRDITIKDMHGAGFNILPEMLDNNTVCMQGHYWTPVPLFGKIPKVDIAVMTGWHAAADQSDGFSPHIFHRRIKQVKINGEPVTEVELFAAVLGEYNIPVAFVTADKLALNRIKKNLPWVSTIEIPKRKLSREEQCIIRKNIETELHFTIKTHRDIMPLYFGEHFVEVVTDREVIRWREVSAVETLRKLISSTMFREYPEYLLSYLINVFRFWNKVKYNVFT
jgi:D-amino peptidase